MSTFIHWLHEPEDDSVDERKRNDADIIIDTLQLKQMLWDLCLELRQTRKDGSSLIYLWKSKRRCHRNVHVPAWIINGWLFSYTTSSHNRRSYYQMTQSQTTKGDCMTQLRMNYFGLRTFNSWNHMPENNCSSFLSSQHQGITDRHYINLGYKDRYCSQVDLQVPWPVR